MLRKALKGFVMHFKGVIRPLETLQGPQGPYKAHQGLISLIRPSKGVIRPFRAL